MKGIIIVAGVALALLTAWFVLIGRFQLNRWLVERRYERAGYRMHPGCNAIPAIQANLNLINISNQIEALQQAPVPDTNELARLQKRCIAAQQDLAFREEDCRKRGHVHTIPVKILTNAPPQ